MIIGQTVMSGGTYFSPWFPRQGDSAVFSAQVIACSTAGTFTVQVQTKNNDDVDPGTVVGSFSGTPNTLGVFGGTQFLGMKELLRFQYTQTGSSNFVHFRVLPPAWESN
jgi:hypothetical protein